MKCLFNIEFSFISLIRCFISSLNPFVHIFLLAPPLRYLLVAYGHRRHHQIHHCEDNCLLNNAVFWVITPCSSDSLKFRRNILSPSSGSEVRPSKRPIEVGGKLGLGPEDVSFFRNVGLYPNCTTLQSRKPHSL
jgi:hypothetical protein